MTHKLNLMKTTVVGIFFLMVSCFSINATAATFTSSTQTIENKEQISTLKTVLNRHFASTKKFTQKKVKQLKKQYKETHTVKKIAWGLGMIIAGALVTLGSILTLSGWWFVVGLGLIIFGAFKIVFGVLGIVL